MLLPMILCDHLFGFPITSVMLHSLFPRVTVRRARPKNPSEFIEIENQFPRISDGTFIVSSREIQIEHLAMSIDIEVVVHSPDFTAGD
jgi:hypothetical protein